MKLPIDTIPGTVPPKFTWWQAVGQMGDGGYQLVQQTGTLPPSVEQAVVNLIHLAKSLQNDNDMLRKLVKLNDERADAPLTKPAQAAHKPKR